MTINLLDDRGVIQQVVREYDTPVGSGSGFVVAPDGVVVTATGVVQSGKDPAVYAANRAFAEYFDVNIPADFSRHKLKDPGLNRRLQACYPPQGANSTCIITAATKVTVFPFADPPAPEGYPADLLHTGASAGAPAVLKMAKGGEDSTLPTVPLGASLGSGIESVDAIGTPVRPNAKTPPKVVTAHLDPPGGRTFKAAERGKLDDFLDDDGQGAAVIDDGKSEVIGMLAGGGGTAQTLTPVEDIRTALVAAGVTPRRGPVDVVYETALAPYHNKFYANSVPVLEQVLRLRPDHAVAQDHLRFARANRGAAPSASRTSTAAAGVPAPDRVTWSPLALGAAGVVLAAVIVAIAVPLTVRRRRRAATAQPPLEPVSTAATRPPHGTIEFPAAGGGSHPPVPRPAGPPALAATGAPDTRPAPSGPETSGPRARAAGPEADRSADTWVAGARRPGADSRDGDGPGTAPQPAVGSAGAPMPSAGASGDASAGGGPSGQLQFCTQCGMRLGKAHRFCGFCGHAVER
ncbi:zinc ribbon domain-containing protein [Sphaerisporangium rubeum]|uniref:Uncharacterized protein n=1 Tax=Sphaerisporangium rubeum TaxID=321317 RepID=A0A7X0IGE0_9ACTN|nr:zinc ribbon domain-containing protein [Sphaerisporangium rubeum]MBB6474761.1 hypothetical protein [Sphaerisporangium rubeum]